MNVFFANASPINFRDCVQHNIFGIRRGLPLPAIDSGDLILLRIRGKYYGVKAIWIVEKTERVYSNTFTPWKHGAYSWIIHGIPLVVEFNRPFNEGFETKRKLSSKIEGLYATRFIGSIGRFKGQEAIQYLEGILREKDDELNGTINIYGEEMQIRQYLRMTVNQLKTQSNKFQEESIEETNRKPKLSNNIFENHPKYGIVGERIDLPILDYAPVNKMGVIFLFGYYHQDFGFSHFEEIRPSFPDAIGMKKMDNGTYHSVRIEFEFRSSNYEKHGHPIAGCDVIVCWEHDWQDCPIQVIGLKNLLH